jgi:hypothetical protein
MASEHWKKAPDAHDFPAAQEFLSLVITPKSAKSLAKALQGADTEVRKAKDLLRASGLPLLRPDNAHVAEDLDKVKKGELLSPVLLVRGDLRRGWPLTVADGYHRICASYSLDENADIPCRVVDLET